MLKSHSLYLFGEMFHQSNPFQIVTLKSYSILQVWGNVYQSNSYYYCMRQNNMFLSHAVIFVALIFRNISCIIFSCVL